jgi:hypothetical protein
MIDSGPDEPRRPPVSDLSWVQTEPVRGASPTPPRAGGGWRRHSRWLFPLAALLVGLGIGSAGKSAPDDAATASAPAATVTATVTTTAPAATVTTTAPPRTKTPAACAKALDLAEQIVNYAGDAVGAAGESLDAASRLDAEAMQAQTAKIEAITPKTSAAIAKYKPLAQACRDAS